MASNGGRRYTKAEKDKAVDLYEEIGPTRAAARLGIPSPTISRWAKARGVSTNTISLTSTATESRQRQLKQRRMELADQLLEDAHKLRLQLWEPTTVVNFGGKDNTFAEADINEPLFADKKHIMSAAGIAIDRVIKIEQMDEAKEETEGVSLIDGLAAQIRLAREVEGDDILG